MGKFNPNPERCRGRERSRSRDGSEEEECTLEMVEDRGVIGPTCGRKDLPFQETVYKTIIIRSPKILKR